MSRRLFGEEIARRFGGDDRGLLPPDPAEDRRSLPLPSLPYREFINKNRIAGPMVDLADSPAGPHRPDP